ncbi:MAG TPA: hypothetical protein VKE51_12755, partial [Vicinamibacterales bacterium]|nr:hypothetical protein [Vicinamibacterales bacterium]
LAPDVDLDAIARSTDDLTGADLEAVCKKAALVAIADFQRSRRGAPLVVRRRDFEAALRNDGPAEAGHRDDGPAEAGHYDDDPAEAGQDEHHDGPAIAGHDERNHDPARAGNDDSGSVRL